MFGFFAALKKRLWWHRKPRTSVVNKIHSDKYSSYSPEKQKKLEDLCEQLFAREELMATGKIQVLGLSKIKRKFGKAWTGIQKIVFFEVEEAISKYLLPTDMFIRYKDENYMIIFADSTIEESQIKMQFIADEIKRRLAGHEEEKIRSIKIEESVSLVSPRDLQKQSSLSDKLEHIYVVHKNEKKDPLREQGNNKQNKRLQKVKVMATFEVDPYESRRTKKQVDEKSVEEVFLDTVYLPFWNVSENALITYLCLPHSVANSDNPWKDFENTELSDPDFHDFALKILRKCAHDLRTASEHNEKLIIICPVPYAVLVSATGFKKYIYECQKIEETYKNRLVFMLCNIPVETPKRTIADISLRLKSHSRYLIAQVEFTPMPDFEKLRYCGFESVGVRILHTGGSEKSLIESIERFTQFAHKQFIKSIFLSGVKSFSVTTSAVCAGVDYLEGEIVHPPVQEPDTNQKFAKQDLFSHLLK